MASDQAGPNDPVRSEVLTYVFQNGGFVSVDEFDSVIANLGDNSDEFSPETLGEYLEVTADKVVLTTDGLEALVHQGLTMGQ